MSDVTVRSTATGVVVELEQVQGLVAAGEPRVVTHGSDAVLVLSKSTRGYFAGDLGGMTIGEALSFIVSGVRTGRLVVSHGAARKVITFRDGQVGFASSSEPRERLGRFLVRKHLISQERLDAALKKVVPGTKLGQVLVQEQVLTAAGLYQAMANLVREILLGLFEMPEADFFFIDGSSATDDWLKLPVRSKELVLEGMGLGEQLVRLRGQLRADQRLRRGSGPLARELLPLAERAAEGATVGELQSVFEGTEFQFLTAVQSLLTSGALTRDAAPAPAVKAPAKPAAVSGKPAVDSATERYQSLIRTICVALQKAGKDLKDLKSFFEDPLPGTEQAFKGIVLADDGTVPVDQVLANVKHEAPAVAKALAFEALDSFINYALFSARNVLPADLSAQLATEFRRIQEGAQ